MSVFVAAFFFFPFPFPVLARTRHHHKSRKICQVVEWSQNNSVLLPTQKEIVCYDTGCCKNGCCPWYNSMFTIVFVLVLFILILKVAIACWRKYCAPEPETRNESQEDILMSVNTSRGTSRERIQNYGTNVDSDTVLPTWRSRKDEERPPTYEEAVHMPRME